MADVTVSADPSYGPPRNVIVAHATGGSILESCEVTRIVGGAEEPIRRQPIVGVSDVTLYDYEALYDRSAVYRIQGLERNTLSTQWTGDKNASTSTLSKDGAVVATNLDSNPSNTRARGGWQTTATQNSGGTWTYSSGGKNGTFYCADDGNVGDVLRITFKEDISSRAFVNEGITGISKPDSNTIIGTVNRTKGPTLNTAQSALTPLTTIRVTQSDYDAMQSIGIDWFSGDSFQAGTTTQYDESSSPVTLSPDSGWLIHPGNPAKSMRLPLGHITGMGDTTRRSNATRHDILGARYPIYTNPGPRYSRELSMKLRTRTADDENMLDALLDDQTPILFNPRGVDASRLNLNPMYLQVGDVTAARYAQSLYPTSDSPQHWRDWTLPCTQVDSPAVSQQAVGWTYAQLLNDNTRYQSVIISYKDYASLQAHNVKDGQ